MATIALSLIGGAIGGSFTGGFIGISYATWGMAAGQLIGSMIDRPEGQHVQGPRLSDLSIGSAAEGANIAMSWGNVRLAGQLVWRAEATEHKHKQKSGGKGGAPSSSSTTYSYSCSFAVDFGFPRGGTAVLRRILLNNKVYVDFTGESDLSQVEGIAYTFYDGGQTKPDSLIESHIGLGNVTARKGRMYIVFEELDLSENFGNNLPSVEVEVAINGANSYTTTDISFDTTADSALIGFMGYSAKYDLLVVTHGGQHTGQKQSFALVSPYTLSEVRLELGDGGVISAPGAKSTADAKLIGNQGHDGNGAVLFVAGSNNPRSFDFYDVQSFAQIASTPVSSTDWGLKCLGNTRNFVFVYSVYQGVLAITKENFTTSAAMPLPDAPYDNQAQTGSGIPDTNNSFLAVVQGVDAYDFATVIFRPSGVTWAVTSPIPLGAGHSVVGEMLADDEGSLWAPGNYNSQWHALYEFDSAGNLISVYNLNEEIPGLTGYWGIVSGETHLYYDTNSKLLSWGGFFGRFITLNVKSRQFKSYSNVTYSNWAYYNMQMDTVFTSGSSLDKPGVRAVKLNNVATTPVLISNIITDICAEVGIQSSKLQIDVTDTLDGYTLKQSSSARSDIEPLLTYAKADAVLSDWKIKLSPRSTTVRATIPFANLGANENELSDDASLIRVEPELIDLPRTVHLQYISSDNGLQPAAVRSDWATGLSERSAELQLAIVMSDEVALNLVYALHQLMYDNKTFKFNLPRDYSFLDPGDIVEVEDLSGGINRVRLTQITRGVNDILEVEAAGDNPENLITNVVVGGQGTLPNIIYANNPVNLVVLDTPLLRDADVDHPGPYLAVYNVAYFRGGSIVYSTDDSAYDVVSQMSTTIEFGLCDTIPAVVDYEDWDDTNTLRVRWLNSEGISSITETNAKAGGNSLVWGKPGRFEVISVVTATQVSGDLWDLTHILRGRRGTNVHMSSHEADDLVFILNETDIVRHVLSMSDAENTAYYKAPLNGQATSDLVSTAWVVGYEPLQPYTPCSFIVDDDIATNDVTINGTPRARRYGSLAGTNGLTDGVGDVDAHVTGYRFEIMDGPDKATASVLATYNEATPDLSYTLAQQEIDYSATLPTVYWRAAAISDLVPVVDRFTEIATIFRPDVPTLSEPDMSVSSGDATLSVELTF